MRRFADLCRGLLLPARPADTLYVLSVAWPEAVEATAQLSQLGLAAVLTAAEVDSTNAWARREAGKGLPLPRCYLAGRQSAGRGSRGRGWVSPPGGLWLSLLLAPLAPPMLPWLALGAGAAAARAVRSVCNLPAQVKWPNDVWLAGGKLAGVLVETAAGEVILGVGLNVSNEPPVPDAVSLAGHGGADLGALAGAFCARVLTYHRDLAAGRPGGVQADWQDLDLLAGKWAYLETKTGVLHVQCLGVTPTGALACREESGRELAVTATSVLSLRPA